MMTLLLLLLLLLHCILVRVGVGEFCVPFFRSLAEHRVLLRRRRWVREEPPQKMHFSGLVAWL